MLSSFPAIFLNILSFAQNSFCVMFEKSHSQNYFLPALWKLYSMSVSAFSLYFCFLENLLCFAKYAFGQDTLSFRIAFFFQTIKFSRYGFSFTYTTVFSFTLTTFFHLHSLRIFVYIHYGFFIYWYSRSYCGSFFHSLLFCNNSMISLHVCRNSLPFWSFASNV